MTSPAGAPILVIGAGPTGLTLACELARHGAPVRIVDRLAEINPHCRATTLHSRTLEIFHDLGIAEVVAAQAPPIRAFNHYAEGRRVSRDELGHVDSPYPYALSLEQSRTEAILEALLERLGVRVERRTELVAMGEGPDAVRATLRGPAGREEVVHAPWLIGCDGAHSTVRHQTHQAFPGSEDSHQYAIADVILDGPIAQDEAHAFLTDRGVLYMFPLPRGRVLVAADITAHHDGATETPALEEIQSLVAERGPAGTRVSEPRWLSYFDYRRSAICAEHRPRGRASGLHAGTQALDAGPLQCGDRRLTLFDLLRGPRHALLLFSGPRAGGAAWRRLAGLAASLGRSHGDRIDVHVVGAPPANLGGEVSIVLDPDGVFHRRYGILGESLYLIRPDGYIGFRSAPIAPRHLRAYLGRLFLSDGRGERAKAR